MKFRDKVTGEIIDVGDAKGEDAWQQLEFKVGTPDSPVLRTFRFRDKETGKEVSALGHNQDEALRVIEEDKHNAIPDKHYTLMEAAMAAPGNVLESGKRTAVSMAQPFLEPKATAKAFRNLTYGIMQMTGLKEGEEYIPAAHAVGKYLEQRYGSWENIKKTLAEDPVGLMADVSMVVPSAAPAALATRAAALPGRVARGVVEAGQAAGPTVRNLIRQHPLASQVVRGMTGTTGRITAGILGAQHAPAAAGAIASTAMAHPFISSLAILGYSRAAQRIATSAARGAERTTPATTAAGKVKETVPELGGPEDAVRVNRNGKGDLQQAPRPQPQRPQITVTPREGYAGPQE